MPSPGSETCRVRSTPPVDLKMEILRLGLETLACSLIKRSLAKIKSVWDLEGAALRVHYRRRGPRPVVPGPPLDLKMEILHWLQLGLETQAPFVKHSLAK